MTLPLNTGDRSRKQLYGGVAQSVEQRTHKPRVVGSNPSPAIPLQVQTWQGSEELSCGAFALPTTKEARAEQPIHDVGSLLLHGGREVAVKIERHANLRIAKQIGNDLRVFAFDSNQGCGSIRRDMKEILRSSGFDKSNGKTGGADYLLR